jgi:predicted ester cyclase
VAVWATYEGTQRGQMGPFPPSGKKVQFDFAALLRVEEGKIAEMWVTWDNMAILAQLGHLPAPPSENG